MGFMVAFWAISISDGTIDFLLSDDDGAVTMDRGAVPTALKANDTRAVRKLHVEQCSAGSWDLPEYFPRAALRRRACDALAPLGAADA